MKGNLAMRRKLVALLVAAAFFFAFVPTVFAASQLYNCRAGQQVVHLILYENTTADHGDGDDLLQICANDSIGFNLTPILHTVPTNCADAWGGNGTWNDCPSSVWVPSGWTLCLYTNASYGGSLMERIGNGGRINLPGFINDAASSVKLLKGALARCTQGASPA